jgi:hypothetical protein
MLLRLEDAIGIVKKPHPYYLAATLCRLFLMIWFVFAIAVIGLVAISLALSLVS